MPWIDAPDPPEPVWRKVAAVVLVVLFLAWAAAGYVSELVGAYR